MKNVFMDTFTLLSVQILISVTELKGVKKLRMEVVQFLDKKHPNHYQVYNLCSERAYDPKHFHIRVSRIMMDDHYVPTLHLIKSALGDRTGLEALSFKDKIHARPSIS
ncbi:phosphatidylinositol 3,4,5-trisphosphate 3-phosphatase and dual-specificity protein phosphatase PTEN-like isoform X2 [Pan troglodytes]|uniref:phosphatidylinositol 3,4,5-trisphosphate 3-phosphatase and dual-specificity protein phosphatase PTEN-like isoform X2 n=1 Tax=Pan troglodytes TaxID=9598 RepID=UPI000511D4DF